MAAPEEKRVYELWHAILLSEEVRSAVDEADSFKSECSELGRQVDRLSETLGPLARSIASAQSLYELPIRRIVPEVSRNLGQALALAHKCKHSNNILRRVVTMTSAADFRKIANLLDASIGDLKWLLSIFGSDGKGGVMELSLPPIAPNDPILAWVWSFIASVHMGPLPDQIEAANELASFAHDNDRNKTIIVEEGGVPPLLKLLKESSAPDAQIAATTALRNLANDRCLKYGEKLKTGSHSHRLTRSSKRTIICLKEHGICPMEGCWKFPTVSMVSFHIFRISMLQ